VSEVIRVLAVIAVIGYVIGRQLMGEPLRGKRVVLLPVILARGPRYPEPDLPPASGQDSQHEADPARYPPRVQPPAGDAAPAGHSETGPGDFVPYGGAAPDLATLARLAGEWLAARRQRGR
jgi:hypothetical protein